MSGSVLRIAFLAAVAFAPAAMAQQTVVVSRDTAHREIRIVREMNGMPGGAGMGMGMKMDMGAMKGGVASMLLGMTGELKLSDNQVTHLAALARSAAAQQDAMHASMDSLHRAMMSHHDAGTSMMERMPADMDARMKSVHEQMHANVRDALSVLTPDQLATAWEHHHSMR